MEIYNRDFQIEYKDDKSPLTEADTKSNEIICEALAKAYPAIPFKPLVCCEVILNKPK